MAAVERNAAARNDNVDTYRYDLALRSASPPPTRNETLSIVA
jgi:hypothetical protein